MHIVDLNGRQDEPSVLSVLGQSHGSAAALEEACAHYRSGEWRFIGWQEGDEILACAGAQQHPNATIGINSIAVATDWRDRGLASALIDALVERMGAQRVVAETDDDAVGFYRSCGFIIEDKAPKSGHRRYWCVRAVAG
jgi:ribosomal protein S18 acetylase RimI-like enzyme